MHAKQKCVLQSLTYSKHTLTDCCFLSYIFLQAWQWIQKMATFWRWMWVVEAGCLTMCQGLWKSARSQSNTQNILWHPRDVILALVFMGSNHSRWAHLTTRSTEWELWVDLQNARSYGGLIPIIPCLQNRVCTSKWHLKKHLKLSDFRQKSTPFPQTWITKTWMIVS